MNKPVSKSFAIVFSVCWLGGIFGTLLAPNPYNVVAVILGVVAIALTIPLLRQAKTKTEEEEGKTLYSSKAWTRGIRFIDSLAVALVAFIAYLTWSFYRVSGDVAVPVGWSTFFYAAGFLLIRSMAVKQKEKALARERENS
jgi:hypothetical protein